jgi:hypothetical protein
MSAADVLVEIRYTVNLSNRTYIKVTRSNIIIVDEFRINASESKFFVSFCFGPARNTIQCSGLMSTCRVLEETLKAYFTGPTWNLRNMNRGMKCWYCVVGAHGLGESSVF